jgi:outer membrane protein assembly factor BamB
MMPMLLCLAILAEPAETDWPQFLGPRRDGGSRETCLNLDWKSKKPAVKWKVPLDGGFSSCCVVGDRLVTMTTKKGRDVVVCLKTVDGSELWSADFAESFVDKQNQGRGPRATPTYHDGNVYCLGPRGDLLCLALDDGKQAWRVNILQAVSAGDHAHLKFYWGMSASPLVVGELVVTQPGGNKGNSVAAFHKSTGKLAWSLGDDPPGYSSPIAITAAGKTILVAGTGTSFLGIDPDGGKLLWRHPFGDYHCNCATPLWADDLLFISCAYGVGSAALTIESDGDAHKVRARWTSKALQNHFTTSVIVDGHVYGSHGDFGGFALKCFDLKSGKQRWSQRLRKSSLLAAEGHLICVTEEGMIHLVEANPERFVAKGELDGLLTQKAWAAPALANRQLYVRDESNLLRIDLSK